MYFLRNYVYFHQRNRIFESAAAVTNQVEEVCHHIILMYILRNQYYGIRIFESAAAALDKSRRLIVRLKFSYAASN